MNDVLNCPNCGAPVSDEKCAYCGTVIYDFTVMDMEKPSYIKIKANRQLIMCKAFLDNVYVTMEDQPIRLYGDDKEYFVQRSQSCTIHVDFNVLPQDGVLYKIKNVVQG